MIRLIILISILLAGCKTDRNSKVSPPNDKTSFDNLIVEKPDNLKTPEGMVWIPGGVFYQGAIPSDHMAMGHEKPHHAVALDGFFMDVHEVTNAQFEKFVKETGYITVAERKVDWEEMKKQLPVGTPKPHDSLLQPGALVFKKAKTNLPNLFDYSQWWEWKIGANWKHPNGPDSSIEGKGDHPVVQIAFEDAEAYCKWSGTNLPTEAEWEYAARGGQQDDIYFWGNDPGQLHKYANTWEGEFPVENTKTDGFERRAPVQNYPPNRFGLYDMAGNVWEWTKDWYHIEYYQNIAKDSLTRNPKGASNPYNPNNPYAKEKIIKGGSFLCSDSYCASYRISARMATTMDSGSEHIGFRTVLHKENFSTSE